MLKQAFEIPGVVPSKKNQRITFVHKHTGRIVNIPSQRYRQWHKTATLFVPKISWAFAGIDRIEMEFWFRTNGRADLTNKAESISDLLVDCGCIIDDCWQVCPDVRLISRGKDKAAPRCRVTLLKKETDAAEKL